MTLEYTDYNGYTIDITDAKYYKEETCERGELTISKATASHLNHEGMYILNTGACVLRCWSDLGNVEEERIILIPLIAAMWFAKQDYPKDLMPENIRNIIALFKLENHD